MGTQAGVDAIKRVPTGLSRSKHLSCLPARFFQVQPHAFQYASSYALAFAHHAEQQMFRSDIMMIHSSCLIHSEFNHFLSARCQTNLSLHNSIALANNILNLFSYLCRLYSQISHDLDGDPIFFADKPEQKMFRTDIIMLEAPGFFLRECKYLARPFAELIKAATTCCLRYRLCLLGRSLYLARWRALYGGIRNRAAKRFQSSEPHCFRRDAQALQHANGNA